jgi:hypothetical protein
MLLIDTITSSFLLLILGFIGLTIIEIYEDIKWKKGN